MPSSDSSTARLAIPSPRAQPERHATREVSVPARRRNQRGTFLNRREHSDGLLGQRSTRHGPRGHDRRNPHELCNQNKRRPREYHNGCHRIARTNILPMSIRKPTRGVLLTNGDDFFPSKSVLGGHFVPDSKKFRIYPAYTQVCCAEWIL